MKAAYPDLLSRLSAEKFEALKADIKKRGVMVPVETDTDTDEIIDGYHRYRACQQLGITTCPQKRRHFKSEAERRWHAVALNIHRRQLKKSQVAAVAAKYRPPMEKAKVKERQRRTQMRCTQRPVVAKVPPPENETRKARENVAAEVGISPRMITDTKKVMNEAPELFNGVLTLPPLIALVQAEFDVNGKGVKRGAGIARAAGALTNSERSDERGPAVKLSTAFSSTLPPACDRCKNKPRVFRVVSETLNMKVCLPCAMQAWRLGLKVEPIEKGEVNKRWRKARGGVCQGDKEKRRQAV